MTSADVDARPVPAGPLAAPAPPGLGVCTGPASRRTVSTLRASSHAPNVSAITCGCACTHARTLTCAHSHAHLYDTCTKQCTRVHNIHLHKTTQYTHVCTRLHTCMLTRTLRLGGHRAASGSATRLQPWCCNPVRVASRRGRGQHALRALLPDCELVCSLYPRFPLPSTPTKHSQEASTSGPWPRVLEGHSRPPGVPSASWTCVLSQQPAVKGEALWAVGRACAGQGSRRKRSGVPALRQNRPSAPSWVSCPQPASAPAGGRLLPRWTRAIARSAKAS